MSRSPPAVVADQPRGQPVVARRAALAQRVERDVGGVGGARRGLERVAAPARPRPGSGSQGPRASRPGAHRHAANGTGRPPGYSSRRGAAAQALGLGIRGRAASPERAARGRRLPRSAARVRLAPSRAAGGAHGRPPAGPAPAAPPEACGDLLAATSTSARCHAYGAPTATSCAAFRGRFDHPPDVVAHPRDEAELEAVLEWALGAGAAVIPFGGGTSVVGGVEPPSRDALRRAWSRSTSTALDRVLEVDPVSLAARIQAGATGPGLEEQLARARPDAAPLPAVVSVLDPRRLDRHPRRRPLRDPLDPHRRPRRVGARADARRAVGVAAAARLGRRRLARPDADRLRGDARGDHRGVGARPPAAAAPARSAGVRFADFAAGARGGPGARPVRSAPVQLPADRPRRGGAHRRRRRRPRAARARLRVGDVPTSSAGWPIALALCERPRRERARRARRRGSIATTPWRSWREAFLRAPYLRDTFVAMGVLSETFETAITWERFPAFHAAVIAGHPAAVLAVCGAGTVTCRFTHVYPDGPAPYYTILAPARRGERARAVGADQARRLRRDHRPRAARSPTTTRSAATTGPGMTASGRSRSRSRCAPPRRRWTRPGR